MSTTLAAAARLPFEEQIQFFRRKLNLPTQAWDDIQKSAHDRAFIVAGAMKADLLADLRAAIDRTIAQGKSIAWFRKEFQAIVAKRGWTGWTGQGSKQGTAWRTRTIYATNLRTSYAAGRWAQLTDPEVMKSRPYWRYVHTSSDNPRLQHKAWHGLVLPAGHAWFLKHYPPNGLGCKCRIEALNQRDLERLGKSAPDAAPDDGTYEHTTPDGRTVTLPRGVQYGWDYAPGRSAVETMLTVQNQKLERTAAPIARLYVQELVQSTLFAKFFSNYWDKAEFPIAVLDQADQLALGAESSIVLLSAESLAAHRLKHPEADLDAYRLAQTILDQGEVYKQGDTRLVYLSIHGVRWRAALKRTGDGRKNYFLTLFKNKEGFKPPPEARIR